MGILHLSATAVNSNHCVICGAASEQSQAPDLESREEPDLDTRPGEPLRSTLLLWIQECRACGYAAPDIGYAAPGAEAVVKSDEYQSRSDAFLRHALLLAQLGHFAEAGWTALHAAWRYDDAERQLDASACRQSALDLWKKGKAAGQAFLDTLGEEFALVVDTQRRAGAFDDARQTCLAALEEEDLPGLLQDVLRLELRLIQSRDTARHTLAELPAAPPGGRRVTT